MSTILKALRRLERERTHKGRPLREQVTSAEGAYRGEVREPRRWPTLLAGIGAGVIAGLAVLFLVFARSEPAEEHAPAEPVAVAATPVAEAAPAAEAGSREGRVRAAAVAERRVARERGAAAARASARDPEPVEEVAVLDRGTPGPRVVAEVEPVPTPDAPRPGSVRPLPRGESHAIPGGHLLRETVEAGPAPSGVAASAPAPAPAAPPEPAPRTERPPAPRAEAVAAPVAKPAQSARAEPAPRAPAPQPEPAAPKPAPEKVAKAAPDPLGGLRVGRTTWHPQAERRVAVIELPDGETRTVHEGEGVAGAVVKRIEPSGVVFEQAGRELRRKLGVR